MWILLSFLSAFGQALGWALKKKTLENKGINNTLGFVSFLVGGVMLTLVWGWQSHWMVPGMTESFIIAALVVIVLNVLAVWTAYRAIDKAALSTLMPFIALTALIVVPVEYLLRGVVPHGVQIIGIAIVVAGAIVFATKERPEKAALATAGYFGVTVFCYSITPPFMAVAVDASGSGLFSAAFIHLGIAFGFIPLMLLAKESQAIRMLYAAGDWKRVLLLMVAVGAVIGLLENGPLMVALETAKASEAVALKRTMPFFALLLGIMMFGEKVRQRHIIGTILLVSGSILIVWFR